MARLPIPGSDDDTWGNILNAYLKISHNADGTLANSTVGTNQLQSGTVTNTQLDRSTQSAIAKANSAVQSVNNKTGISVTLASTDLSDVSISSPSNKQILAYNSTTSKWTNQAAPSAPLAINALDYGMDPTGASYSDTGFAAAITASNPTATNGTMRSVYVPAGTYKFQSPFVLKNLLPANTPVSFWSLICDPAAVFIYSGSGIFLDFRLWEGEQVVSGFINSTIQLPNFTGAGPAAGQTAFQIDCMTDGALSMRQLTQWENGVILDQSGSPPNGFFCIQVKIDALLFCTNAFQTLGSPATAPCGVQGCWIEIGEIEECGNAVILDSNGIGGNTRANHVFVYNIGPSSNQTSGTGITDYAANNVIETNVIAFCPGGDYILPAGAVTAPGAGLARNAVVRGYFVDKVVLNGQVADIVNYLGPGPGPLTSGLPSVPTSGNPFPLLYRNAMYVFSGGTITTIKVNGVTTGLTTGAVYVPSGQTITLTYTGTVILKSLTLM